MKLGFPVSLYRPFLGLVLHRSRRYARLTQHVLDAHGVQAAFPIDACNPLLPLALITPQAHLNYPAIDAFTANFFRHAHAL